jgi:hypothetical protein
MSAALKACDDPHETYWRELVADAAEECEAVLTAEQVNHIADTVRGGHENYGMAFYQPESPYPREIERLEKALRKERDKRGCPTCGGRGRVEYQAGVWWCNTACDKCNGEGKIAG